MDAESSLLKAGRILLLVGAIIQVVGAVFLLAAAVGVGFLFSQTEAEGAPTWIFGLYGGLALIILVGAVVAFIAYGRARRGDARAAWVRGLVASLLPPVQVVTLIGAILCLVSPEAEAQKAQGAHAPSPPPTR